jgi:hypothetical protein
MKTTVVEATGGSTRTIKHRRLEKVFVGIRLAREESLSAPVELE